ncbi:ATP-binding protein [Enterobacter roggenkampii]|uniref:AAA family ATPase n=1 Tax=Enterobacter roggenkampii TaxID=1812935 RepID=UPI002003AA03|nr:AAA family ATPase [Enterobacter roggenkampii]MCK7151821.1 ATP-binding protein [Enterobacter roggenkampii]
MNLIIGSPGLVKEETIFLEPNKRWNDFSFVTTFYLYICNEKYVKAIGEVKIGFCGQTKDMYTWENLGEKINKLPQGYFSLGQDPDYYLSLRETFGKRMAFFLESLNDVVYDENIFQDAQVEDVFKDSLTRYVSISSIMQFKDILETGVALRNYGFKLNFSDEQQPEFIVIPDSKPPTNVHVLIGSNGVGKSFLLREIVSNIDNRRGLISKPNGQPVSAYDYGLLLYFSLSVFDKPFKGDIFNEVRFSTEQTRKKYIGIYDQQTHQLKDLENDLGLEFAKSLNTCLFGSQAKLDLWYEVVSYLEADVIFRELNLKNLSEIALRFNNEYYDNEFQNKQEIKFLLRAAKFFNSLSSGHAAILYYLIHVVELIEAKTICIFDEPENHLHPPLLSSFIRALSHILSVSNGMAIIATHSPVILQEVPRSCIWKVNRVDDQEHDFQRPSIETFGESVGEITSEIFSLDLRRSGFYSMLENDAKRILNAREVLSLYKGQVGLEGRTVIISNSKKA